MIDWLFGLLVFNCTLNLVLKFDSYVLRVLFIVYIWPTPGVFKLFSPRAKPTINSKRETEYTFEVQIRR